MAGVTCARGWRAHRQRRRESTPAFPFSMVRARGKGGTKRRIPSHGCQGGPMGSESTRGVDRDGVGGGASRASAHHLTVRGVHHGASKSHACHVHHLPRLAVTVGVSSGGGVVQPTRDAATAATTATPTVRQRHRHNQVRTHARNTWRHHRTCRRRYHRCRVGIRLVRGCRYRRTTHLRRRLLGRRDGSHRGFGAVRWLHWISGTSVAFRRCTPFRGCCRRGGSSGGGSGGGSGSGSGGGSGISFLGGLWGRCGHGHRRVVSPQRH